MKFPSREIVERIRREYPAGTRVELVRMDDAQAPPAGTKGTVKATRFLPASSQGLVFRNVAAIQ